MSEKPTSSIFSELGIQAAAMSIYRKGLQASREQNYPDAIRFYSDALDFPNVPTLFCARLLELRGECYWLMGDFNAAEQDYRASLAASNDPDQIARARVRLGEVADFCGRAEEARPIYHQALAEGTHVSNLLVIGRARRGLGILNRKQGNTEKAVRHLTQALAAFRQLGDPREQARVLTSLGRTHHARGEYQNALTYHQEALKLLDSLQDKWRIVQALNDIGECHQSLYDIQAALDYHKRALAAANEYNANVIKPEIQRNYGVDLVEQGDMIEGLAYLQRALNNARNIGNREQEALALYNLARAYLRIDNLPAAQRSVAELHEVAESLDVDRYRALAAFVRGELLFHQDNRVEAIMELNKAALAAQTAVDRGVLWKLHATMSYVIDNEAIAAVHRDIAASFVRQTAEPITDPKLKSTFVNAPPVLAILHAAGIDPAKL